MDKKIQEIKSQERFLDMKNQKIQQKIIQDQADIA